MIPQTPKELIDGLVGQIHKIEESATPLKIAVNTLCVMIGHTPMYMCELDDDEPLLTKGVLQTNLNWMEARAALEVGYNIARPSWIAIHLSKSGKADSGKIIQYDSWSNQILSYNWIPCAGDRNANDWQTI